MSIINNKNKNVPKIIVVILHDDNELVVVHGKIEFMQLILILE